MTHTADADAVARCGGGGGGDVEALEGLYASHAPACLSLARSVLVDPHMAEDAVQEAFLQLWRDADQFDGRRSSVRSWLLMVTRCKAVDRVRSEERPKTSALSPDHDRADDGPGPEAEVIIAMLGEQTRAALGEITAPKREAIVLAFWGGYTQPEIASITGSPLGTVKSRMRDGMRTLGDVLVRQGDAANSTLTR